MDRGRSRGILRGCLQGWQRPLPGPVPDHLLPGSARSRAARGRRRHHLPAACLSTSFRDRCRTSSGSPRSKPRRCTRGSRSAVSRLARCSAPASMGGSGGFRFSALCCAPAPVFPRPRCSLTPCGISCGTHLLRMTEDFDRGPENCLRDTDARSTQIYARLARRAKWPSSRAGARRSRVRKNGGRRVRGQS